MSNIKFKIGFDVDKGSLSQIRSEISQINKEIQSRGAESGLTKEMKEALKYTELVDKALDKASNNKLDKVNTKVFNEELKKSNLSLSKMYASLKNAGVDGSEAIRRLNRELKSTGVEAKESSKILDNMFTTFTNTAKWTVASSAMNQITGSIQRAVGFTKSLDESLNHIRVVSGQNSAEMASFAKEANEAAKALGKTTTEYTDASLLFFQQGKTASEVRELTNATLMAANVTGGDVTEMANLITSALNGYSWAAEDAIRVTDTLAAVGAATGSDFNELAIGMSKVASQAATVGVPFEKLNAMLATITETTREAPETIGTSLKTIFARMSEIKLSGSAVDEDGVTMSLGKVQDALSLIDVSLVDNNDNMRDMATVIEEIGGKWSGLNVETKSAIANAMAGQRQASRLMALFNQWERYEYALAEAMDSTGATMEQNEVRMDSMSYKTQQMRAEIERLWMNLIDSDFLKGGVDALTSVLDKVNTLSESLGGMSSILIGVGAALAGIFSKQIISGFTDISSGFRNMKMSAKEAMGSIGGQDAEVLKEKKIQKGLSTEEFGKYKEEKGKLQDIELEIKSNEKLKVLKKDLLALDREYVKVGKETVNLQDRKADLALIEAKKKALKGISELEESYEAFSLTEGPDEAIPTYEEFIGTLNRTELEMVGISKEALASEGSFEQLKASIRGMQTVADKGFFPNVDTEIQDLEQLQEELDKLEREAEEAQDAIEQLNIETSELERGRGRQAGRVQEMETQGLGGFKTEKLVQGVAAVSGAVAMAIPMIQTLGDESMSSSEKMDSITNSVMGMSMSLLMSGNPYLMIAGGIGLVGSAIVKGIKHFSAQERMLRKNEKALENYRESLSAVKETQKSLSDATAKMAEAEQMAADGLTTEELESYNELVNSIAASTPEVVAYYDAFGNAVLKSREEVDELNKSLKEQEKLMHKTMEAQASSFAAEVAYLQTQGKQKEKSLNEKLARESATLEEAFASGSADKIKKAQEAINETTVSLNELRAEFDAIGEKAQETIVNPFIQGNEVFKEMGTELQGFVGLIFNSDEIQKGLDRIAKDGSKTTKQLTADSKRYIESFEKGILELGEAFSNINSAQDEETKKLISNLSSLPQDVQKTVGEQLLTVGLALDQEQVTAEIKNIAKFIDEQGNMDAFGMVKYFKETVGPNAKIELEKNIRDGIVNGVDGANLDIMIKEKYNSFGDTLGRNIQQDLVDIANQVIAGTEVVNGQVVNTYKSKYTDEVKAELNELATALTQGGEELTNAMMNSSAESLKIFQETLQTQKSTFAGTDQYEEYASNLDSIIEKAIEGKSALQELNFEIEGGGILSAIGEDLTSSIEGQIEAAELYNEMVQNTSEVMGEGGLFNVDIAEIEEATDALGEYVENMSIANASSESGAEAIKEFSDSTKNLEESAKRVGDSFEGMLSNMGEDKFGKLADLAGTSIDNIKTLAQAAKEGNIEAAKSLQTEMGRVYATLNKDNVEYFNNFKKTNTDRIDVLGQVTGINADQYRTLAEYSDALERWKSENLGEYAQWQVDTVKDALQVQVDNMGSAAETQVNINGEMMDATGRASAIAQLSVAKAAVEAAQNGAEGGYQAAAAMIGNLQGVNEAVGATLGNITDYLVKDASDIDELLRRIQAEIDKYAEGGEGAPPIKLGGFTVPSFKDFNFKPSSGMVNVPSYSQGTTGTGTEGGKLDTSGGGGDKDGGAEEKEVEDLEWEEDIYHDINVQLELKQQLLDKLKKQQDKLYGKELLDNLAQQKKALQDQQKLLEKKLEMQKKDLEQQKQALSKQGAKFNVDGTIANYNELLKQKVAYVNSLSGEAKEATKEEFDSLVEMMEKYEELMMNNINETENAIQDAIDAQREIFLQEFEYKITVQLELSEDFQKAVQFQKDMATDFEDYSENYQRTMDQLGQKLGEVGAIQEHINNIQNDTSLTEKERLEMLSEYTEKMKEAVKDAKKLQEEMKKLVEGALKDGLDLIKEHLDQYKNIDSQIKHIQGTLKLLGQEQNYEFLDELYEAQYQNIQSQLDVLLAQKNALIAQRDTYAVGSDEWKMFNEQLTKTEDQINKLSQDSIKVLQDSFKNSINAIMNDLDKALSKGIGLKELRDEYDKLKDSRKEYLDIEEKVTEVGKLQKKLQDAMKSTTDPKQLAALQKFKETELKNLREKDKLTQYDLDRANQLYELTLKQIALDEQRNAKAIMRLIRDAQGNWVYEFVEDAEAVAQAQDDLSKELEKLQELDKKQFEKTQEDMIKEKEKYVKQVQDIINKQMKGEFESDDAFKEALAQAQTDFNDRMLELGDRLNEAQVNGITSSLATMLQAYYENDEALGMLSENEEEMMKQLADAIGGDFTQLNELMAALNSGNLEDFNAMAEGMGLNASELQTALEGVTGGIREDWGGNITDMIGDVANLGTDTATTVDQILAKWEEYKGKVEETTGKTGDSLDGLKDKLGAVEGATDILNQKTNDLIGKFEEEMTQIGKVVKEYDKLKGAYDDNIKKATDYIGKLDELIKKQKEQATGVTTPTAPTQPPSTSSSGSTGSGSGSTTTTPPPAANKNPSFSNNEAVRVKSKSKYFAVSSLTGNYGWANTGTKYLIDDPSRYKPMSGYSGNVHISSSSGGDLGWLPKNMLEKFDTGGYTGAWGNDGKVAMLHEKEIVLNKQDTKNILDAVKTVRGSEGAAGLGQLFKASVQQAADRIVGAINRLGTGMAPNKSELSSLGPADSSNEIKQTVQINADFSGVKNSGEIEKAFNSLAIQASQYASKRN